jgi:PAS domain S-box-containing protein
MTSKPTSILVVDDAEASRYTLVRMLQKAHYEVREAASGKEALRLAAEQPDLIILDINLPDLTGHEVRRQLKGAPATAAIPVLHLSASFVESDNRAEGLEGGADGYLTYPVEQRELIANIEALLRARRAEREVRAQRELLHVTLSSIGDAVIATDAAGRVTFLNPAAQSLTGWGQADAQGKLLTELFRVVDERTREFKPNLAERVLSEGKVVGLSNHAVLIARDGSERAIDASAAPIRESGGPVVGMVLVFRDVTERRRAEDALRESEEHFRLMVEDVQDHAIIRLDSRGRVASWNEGARRVLGYTEDEILGQPTDVFFTPEDRRAGLPEKELQQATTSGRATDDNWLLRKDGSRFWASGATTALRDSDGAPRGFVKILRDLTERKGLEEALRQRAEALADADRRKDEFLAMLAHELRNPLAPLRNALHMVRLADPDPLPVVQGARDVMERQLEHLVRLVDDLLDVSRISRGKIHLQKERVDLAAIMARAIESSRPMIEARRHALEVSLAAEAMPVEADPLRLAQVFLNLLTNAAKYTPQGGVIRLTAQKISPPTGPSRSAGEQRPEVVVRVRDSGIGIAAELLPKVFDLFIQADRSLDRSEGGLGVGLTLVRQLTEMHGGTAEAFSEGNGRGSEFVIRLPLAPGEAPAEAAGQAVGGSASARPTPCRILVVDDNRDSAESLAMLLRLLGHDVRTAYDGRLALQLAAAYRPDVALLDIGLPGLTGLEVCQRLRADPDLKRVVAVALTGYGLDEDKRRSGEAGFDAHLTKPVDIEALQELLGRPELTGPRTGA